MKKKSLPARRPTSYGAAFLRLVVCGLLTALGVWPVRTFAVSLPTINTNNVINIAGAPYNAVGDGVMTNTTAIQNAINAAALGGTTNGLKGGVVEIPTGVFLCGPLTMKSFVDLEIDSGATLKMLPYGSYPGGNSPTDFISASGLNNIQVSGPGVIEGQGLAWWQAFEASGIGRPKAMFAPSNCRTVLVENVTLQSPPNTHISLRNLCREVTIRGITINTTSDVLSDNTDGIDINATNCLVQNCFISCGDDHIAMGGGSSAITISNCIFGNGHGISIGSSTDNGGLHDLLVTNCSMTIADGASLSSGIRMKSARDRGGFARNLAYANLALTNVQNPIFISSYYPDNTIPSNPVTDTGSNVIATTPIWRDITISNVNIVASSGRNAGRIYGLPEMLMTNLTLTKVTVKADQSFVLYHVRNARFVDSQINVPASVNTFSLYNVDLTLTNTVFNNSLVKINGWSSPSITNQLAFFNARVAFTDTNVLSRTASISLGNSLLAFTNNWNMNPWLVMNFTLGASNATVFVASNLTFNPILNINAGAGFTNGAYTIFTYGKNLTWGTPLIGSAPPGFDYALDTNTAGQIKLIVTSPAPDIPGNPMALGTNLLVKVQWLASSNATGYNLKRSTTNGGPYSIIGWATSTDYLDSAVIPGTPYYYVVSATNSATESSNSIQASAIPLPSLASTNLNFQAVNHQLQVSWPQDHLGWRLQIQTNGLGTGWTDWPDSTNGSHANIVIDPANASVFLRLVYP